jgi:hypothetical protein
MADDDSAVSLQWEWFLPLQLQLALKGSPLGSCDASAAAGGDIEIVQVCGRCCFVVSCTLYL